MIDRSHDLPVTRQCQILNLARSTAYYEPVPISPEDLELMRRIDDCTWNIRSRALACCATCSIGKAIVSDESMCAR